MCDGLNVEWANSQLNSPLFHENPASHTFFIRDFPESRFFFSKKVQLLPKRINVRFRLARSIYVLPLHLCFTFLVNNQLRIHSFYTRPYSTKSDDAKQWHCLTTSLQLVGRPKRTFRFLKCVEVINKNAGTSFKASLSQIFKQYPCEAILVTICLSGG